MKKIGDYLEIKDLVVETARLPETSGVGQRAVIRAFVEAQTPVKVLYMASLELDNMEMHESFRLVFEPGESRCSLPEIVVVNPICSENTAVGNYNLTLKIYASGGVVHDFSATLRF